MPYLNESIEKNCFRCQHLSASYDGYVCGLGFGEAQTIWTGDLALICPLFELYVPLKAVEEPEEIAVGVSEGV